MPRPCRRAAARLPAAMIAALLAAMAGLPPAARAASVEDPTWRVEFANDTFFGKDNKISSGFSIQRHSSVADHWDGIEGLPGFMGAIGAFLPTLSAPWLHYRAAVGLRQVIQTPDDLSDRALIRDDVPYAAAILLQGDWYAFDDTEFRGVQIILGLLGPGALGREVQRAAHRLTGSELPQGWDNQLHTEPLLNVNYLRKWKVVRWQDGSGLGFDAAVGGNVALGNLIAQGGGALELRFGQNMPRGFAYAPEPFAVTMDTLAELDPPDRTRPALYASLMLRGTATARNVFLDGNTFRDSHSVDKEPFVGQLIAGLHYERPRWGVHLTAMLTTDDVDTSSAREAEGGEMVGSIILEWRF